MSLSRRTFLAMTGSIAAVGAVAPQHAASADQARRLRLTARLSRAHLLEAGQPETAVWAYDGSVPGPTLHLRQGESIEAQLINQLPQPTTIHWHGLRIDNSMDGVAGLTQPAVQPGKTYSYRFAPPDAGTFWYHPHYRTWEQLARGLYGVLIVQEASPPAVDQDLIVVFDDWRIGENGQIDEASFDSMHDISHAGRLGNILTLNGKFSQDFEVLSGQRLRLRLLNAATARVVSVRFADHAPLVIALDGQPVSRPFAPRGNTILLAPAQRADLILDCDGEPGQTSSIEVDVGRETLVAGRLVYGKKRRQRANTLSEFPVLPANPMPTDINPDDASPVDLVMTGGARAPFPSAVYQGENLSIRELVRRHKKAWAFNGVVGFPDKPLAVFANGKTAVIKMVNRTAWPHAMHFHGHHVREIQHSAREPSPHWRDTIFMRPDETVTVAFNAHNPGRWMLHCHMLGHQRGGMSTWYEVG
mgnify:FL=1